MTFEFFFDPEEVNTWLEQTEVIYSGFDQRYSDEWDEYIQRVAPLYEQINAENEDLQVRIDSLDVLTEEQLTDTFYDIG